MAKTNKILLTAFALLLLITLGEILYYFFYLSPNTQKASLNVGQLNQQSSKNAEQKPNPDQAVSEETLNFLRNYNKNLVTSAEIVVEQEGIIQGIATKPGTAEIPGSGTVNYLAYITITNNEARRDFVFTEEIIDRIYITDNNRKEVKLVDPSSLDLKIGDRIVVRWITDLTKKDYVSITRIDIIKK